MAVQEFEEKELPTLARYLLTRFKEKQLVLLQGPLGAGKTEFVKQVLKVLKCNEVQSPTYGLIHEYATDQRENVFHVDLYRIDGNEDLDSSGFWDLFSRDQGLIFVEWADRIDRSQFPLHWSVMRVDIGKLPNDEKRSYEIVMS